MNADAEASLNRVRDAVALRAPDKVPFHAYQSPELAMRMAGLRVHQMYLAPDAYFEAVAHSNEVFHNDFVQDR